MKGVKLCSLVCCFFIIALLAFPIQGNAQSDYPDNDNLRARNAALKMTGILFPSGMRQDENGYLQCNGIEII